MVIAFWGDKIAEDIRHEVTHGYLHAAVSNLPLWLDEGLAEFFEVQPAGSINEPHVRLLAEHFRRQQWRPDLNRLESIRPTAELKQLEYAEAWLWTHFLLTTDAHTNSLVCQTLKILCDSNEATPIAAQVAVWMPDWEQRIVRHLKQLAESH
jgi:hypothetical protein